MESVGMPLAIIAGISGLVLSWLSYRRQGTAMAIENLSKAYEILNKDYQRQAIEIKNLRCQLEREQLRRITLQEHLDIAREVIEKLQHRIEILEAEVKRLQHLETNNGDCIGIF